MGFVSQIVPLTQQSLWLVQAPPGFEHSTHVLNSPHFAAWVIILG